MIEPTVFDKLCSRLLEPKRNIVFHTKVADFQYPIEMAFTGFVPRLPSDDDLFDPCTNVVGLQINPAQKRFANEGFMFDRQCLVNRHTIVRSVLIFNGTANRYMFVAVPPIIGQRFSHTINAFGNHEERQIIAFPNHFPCFLAPRVGIFDEKIGSEAGIDLRSGGDFVFAGTFLLKRQIKVFGFSDDGAVNIILGIPAIDVTVPATFTQLTATVLRIPHL